ncbi:MAG TPA: uroporphyrinogen decarboxylase [Planctomycetes bacterium]|nr:uroporphyrinogen decarboxylase [Planctomycetota bacterium]
MDLTPRERLLRACRREPVDRPPVWLMRQAGRYMAEYRAVKEKVSFLELCKDPELCRDVTLQPLRAFGLEVGIVFSDILLPAEAMGMDLSFGAGAGPQLSPPIRTRKDVEALRDFDPAQSTPWPAEAQRLLRATLGDDLPIIGFCGAPFTVASYMIEGGSSRVFENTKRMLFADPSTFQLLMERLTANLIPYLLAQVEAGAPVVQVFDSWAGCLDRETYAEFAQPWTCRLINAVKEKGVPVISYVSGGGHLIELMADSGADVVSLDWRVDPEDARRCIGHRVALQGNLDPGVLLAGPDATRRAVTKNLQAFGTAPGHIFNLGSGIMKWTPPESVQALVDCVHGWRP